MSPLVSQIVGSDGKPDGSVPPGPAGMDKYFPNCDLHRSCDITGCSRIFSQKLGKFVVY
jgi:hypothetical protein